MVSIFLAYGIAKIKNHEITQEDEAKIHDATGYKFRAAFAYCIFNCFLVEICVILWLGAITDKL
jgi:hypothetical protein